LPPRRDHRERIGYENTIELRLARQCLAEQGLRIEAGCIAFRDRDPVGEPGARDRRPRRLEHFAGYVEAVEPRLRIAARGQDQITAGPTADLEDRSAWRRLQIIEQPVAPKEIILARGIIEIPLIAVDPVHVRAMIAVAHATAASLRSV